MFNLRKRVERIEEKLKQKENRITQEDLYKFYLDRRLEEINGRLKNKIAYTIKIGDKIKRDLSVYGPPFYSSSNIINIKIDEINLLRKEYNTWEHEDEIFVYKVILNYLNKKSIGYFIKLDKKIEDLKKHNKELDKKKLNLEEELKKII